MRTRGANAPVNSLVVSVDDIGSPVVVTVSGDIDLSSAPLLEGRLNDLVDAGHSQILINASGLTFFDASGLGMLIRVQRSHPCDPVGLQLAWAPPRVVKVFELTGLTSLLHPAPAGRRRPRGSRGATMAPAAHPQGSEPKAGGRRDAPAGPTAGGDELLAAELVRVVGHVQPIAGGPQEAEDLDAPAV